MATFFQIGDRRVIPNFRSLQKTLELGELSSFSEGDNIFQPDNLDPYIQDFLDNKTIAYAGDLISTAVINNQKDNEIVIRAANLILKSETKVPISLFNLASHVIDKPVNIQRRQITSIDDFLEYNSLPFIYSRIRDLKSKALKFHHNPFLFTELARLHSIIGQEEVAKKNITIAKQLASTNRYVLRSFARLMAHFKEVDIAHDALRKNSMTKFDPWLVASEISLASLRGKTSNLIKTGNDLIKSRNFDFFSLTELASAMGTLEMSAGNRKKSKVLFETALRAPNDNSLAQIEWANNRQHLFDFDVTNFDSNNYEAYTLSNFNSKNWHETIDNAEKWFMEMPFAKRPVLFGHHTSSFYLEDQETAIKFCKAGLVANPNDPEIINNIAYSYAVIDDIKKAFEYLNKVQISDVKEVSARICLIATTGLAYYRSGERDRGKSLYMEAITEARRAGNKFLADFALLHLVKEELLSKSTDSKTLYEEAMNINSGERLSIKTIKNRLSVLFEKLSAQA